MNNQFILLTRLLQRRGFNSGELKCICSISSSADVLRSRGEFDRIKQNFMINPSPIGSQSSLNVRGSRRTQDLAQKLLYCFAIQSRVKRRRESLIWWEPIDGHDFMWFEFPPFRCHRRIEVSPRVAPTIAWSRDLILCVWLFHLRNQRCPITHVLLMAIRWTPVHTTDALHLMHSHLTPATLACVLH